MCFQVGIGNIGTRGGRLCFMLLMLGHRRDGQLQDHCWYCNQRERCSNGVERNTHPGKLAFWGRKYGIF